MRPGLAPGKLIHGTLSGSLRVALKMFDLYSNAGQNHLAALSQEEEEEYCRKREKVPRNKANIPRLMRANLDPPQCISNALGRVRENTTSLHRSLTGLPGGRCDAIPDSTTLHVHGAVAATSS